MYFEDNEFKVVPVKLLGRDARYYDIDIVQTPEYQTPLQYSGEVNFFELNLLWAASDGEGTNCPF